MSSAGVANEFILVFPALALADGWRLVINPRVHIRQDIKKRETNQNCHRLRDGAVSSYNPNIRYLLRLVEPSSAAEGCK